MNVASEQVSWQQALLVISQENLLVWEFKVTLLGSSLLTNLTDTSDPEPCRTTQEALT